MKTFTFPAFSVSIDFNRNDIQHQIDPKGKIQNELLLVLMDSDSTENGFEKILDRGNSAELILLARFGLGRMVDQMVMKGLLVKGKNTEIKSPE